MHQRTARLRRIARRACACAVFVLGVGATRSHAAGASLPAEGARSSRQRFT